MSARERFLKKVQQNNTGIPPSKKTAEAEILVYRQRMDDFAQQISQWFAGTSIEVVLTTKHIHDLSTIGFSLSSGICRYDITAICLQNGNRSVSITPEQLCRGAERGCVIMRVDVLSCLSVPQIFYLSMAPESGWFIRREQQGVKENVIMTEDLFFQAIDKLA